MFQSLSQITKEQGSFGLDTTPGGPESCNLKVSHVHKRLVLFLVKRNKKTLRMKVTGSNR